MLSLNKKTKSFLILFGFFTLIFLLRLPVFTDPLWHPDEGIYSSIATQLDKGELLYKDAWDNKPPMIFYVYIIFYKIFGFNVVGIRILGLLASFIAFYYFYKIFRLLFAEVNIVLPALIFILLLCTPLIDGNVANAENLFLPVTTAGLFYFLKFIREKVNRFLFISSFLFGLAFTIKVHPGIEFIPVFLLTYILFLQKEKKFNLFAIKNLAISLFLFFLPYLFFIVLFAVQGNLNDFLRSMFGNGLNYIQPAKQNGFFILEFINSLYFRGLVLVIATMVLTYKMLKSQKRELYFLILLAFYIVFAIFLSGREYAHYLIEGLTIFGIGIGGFVKFLKSKPLKSKFIWSLAAFLGFLMVPFLFFAKSIITNSGDSSGTTAGNYFSNTINYYPNYIKLVTGKLARDEYNKGFYGDPNVLNKLLDESKNIKDTKTFLWDDRPWFYFANNINDPIKYVTIFHFYQEHLDVKSLEKEINLKSQNILINRKLYDGMNSEDKFLLLNDFQINQDYTDYILFSKGLL